MRHQVKEAKVEPQKVKLSLPTITTIGDNEIEIPPIEQEVVVPLKNVQFDFYDIDKSKQLADTFGGAATVQANTFEGQIQRLRVGFDEAKESIGARLLPILKQTLDYVINTVIPQFIQFKDNALKPITNAIENNREGFEKFVAFLKNFVIPFLIQSFGQSLETIGKIAGGVITVISKVTSFISSAVNAAIDGINALIRAYNKIPLLPDISTISNQLLPCFNPQY